MEILTGLQSLRQVGAVQCLGRKDLRWFWMPIQVLESQAVWPLMKAEERARMAG